MKHFLVSLLLSSLSLSLFAEVKMRPGSWRIQTKMSSDGKEQIDPMAALSDALKKMPAAQRKMVEQAMNKAMKEQGQKSIQMDKNGMTVCYTKEMLDSDLGLKKQYESQKCQTSNYLKTDSSLTLSFNCPDGAKGDIKMNLTDSTHFNGDTKMVSAAGKKTEIKTSGEFVSEKCE